MGCVMSLFKHGQKFKCVECDRLQGEFTQDIEVDMVLDASMVKGIGHNGWVNGEIFCCKDCGAPLTEHNGFEHKMRCVIEL